MLEGVCRRLDAHVPAYSTYRVGYMTVDVILTSLDMFSEVSTQRLTGEDMSTITITMHERRFFERIYLVVEQVPRGQVSTYGDIAAIVGGGCDARVVGLAMGDLGPRAAKVPWQRIINRSGGISTQGTSQRELLVAEGIEFDEKGKVPLDRFRWAGPDKEWAANHGFNVLPARGSSKEEEDKSQLRLF